MATIGRSDILTGRTNQNDSIYFDPNQKIELPSAPSAPVVQYNNYEEERRRAEEERRRLEEERQSRLTRLKEKEDTLRSALVEKQDILDQGLEAQLDRLLADVGFAAGERRRVVGESYADRGLSRSSFAQNQLNEVTLKEQEEKAPHRLATFETSQQAKLFGQTALDTIQQRREKLEVAKSQSELDSAENTIASIDMQRIKDDYNARLTEMSLDSNEQTFLTNSLGSLIDSIGSIFGSIL